MYTSQIKYVIIRYHKLEATEHAYLQVLWKDRARHMKPFSRTSEILVKEKEMRNVGMISASLTRKQKLIAPTGRASPPKEILRKTSDPKKSALSEKFVPKQMVQLRPTTPDQSEHSTRNKKDVPGRVEGFHVPTVVLKSAPTSGSHSTPVSEEVSTAASSSKGHQSNASAPIVEDALLSTIPPAKPPRPKFVASSGAGSAHVATPLEDDSVLSTIPKRSAGTGTKRKDRGTRDNGKGEEPQPAASLNNPKSKIKLETEPEPPVRSTSLERGRHLSAPSKPKRNASVTPKPTTSTSDHPKVEPSKAKPNKISGPAPVTDSSLPSPSTPPEPPPTSRFTVTLQHSSSQEDTILQQQHDVPMEPLRVTITNGTDNPSSHQNKTSENDAVSKRTRLETHSPAEDEGSKKELEKEEPGTDLDGADDNASIDSLVSLQD